MASSHTSTVMSLASDVKSGSARDRDKAIEEFIHLMNPQNRTVNLTDLTDKSYHDIFEILFGVVIREKPGVYDKRKKEAARTTSSNRLSRCANAIRMAAARGGSRLGRKTLLALIDHITQVLPGPDDDFVAPLVQDYVKTLSEVLSRQSYVEYLSRQDARLWEISVDFLLDVATYVLPSETYSNLKTASRSSPAAGTSTPRSTLRSSNSTQSQKRGTQLDSDPLKDALRGLQYLIHASNAPVSRRAKEIAGLAVRVVSMKHLSLGSMQTMCFAVCNTILSAIQAEDVIYAKKLVKDLLPLMSYWWRADKVSQDELIRGLRNEISKTIILTQLHIERLIIDENEGMIDQIENLVEPLWLEYSKRSEAFRLQLHDLTFDILSLPLDAMRLDSFGIRLHNTDGESQWALMYNMALLEGFLWKQRDISVRNDDNLDDQPRKRQRTKEQYSRLRLKLRSKDLGIRKTALQVVAFMLERGIAVNEDASLLLDDLVSCAADKNSAIASWAMVAANSCVSHSEPAANSPDVWKQLWHIAVRQLSVQATARAACLLVHRMIEAETLPYNSVSEDINSIVTTADVNGPGILCDTSVSLMFHLFHLRNARLPSASQATCNHIIRWIFLKWNPSELAFASSVSQLIQPKQLVSLVRICCGAQPLPQSGCGTVPGTSLSQIWKYQLETSNFNEYLLLLNRKQSTDFPLTCAYITDLNTQTSAVTDLTSFYASKKLCFELFCPKLEELVELCSSWAKKPSEGGTQISLERFQSLLSACVAGSFLAAQFVELDTNQAVSLESTILNLVERSLILGLDSVEPSAFVDLTLRTLRPCTPGVNTANLNYLHSNHPGVLRLLSMITTIMDRKQSAPTFAMNSDLMDLDDEFDSQSSRATSMSQQSPIPRHNIQLSTNSRAFYVETRQRLCLLRALHDDAIQIGLVPDSWLDNMLSMQDDDLLSCQSLLVEIFSSDLVTSSGNALSIIQRLGSIMSSSGYQCCEVAQTTCIDVIDGLHNIWLGDNQELSEGVGDLYHYFIKACLPSNLFSAKAQISMARLLFTLLKANPGYGTSLGLDSCRTSLLNILTNSSMIVKCFVAEQIAGIFELFILMLHDEIFVDVLASLPTDPEDTSGIAFRLFTLSKLACRWPTLLRRCIYHIFETPGKITQSIPYAQWCLADISTMLNLRSPKDLFHLFSRQLLYTWMENDTIEDIPFAVFGFDQLSSLLRSAQAEAIALAVMRGQTKTSAAVARSIGVAEYELIQTNFSTALSYSMVYGDAFGELSSANGDEYIKKKLGSKVYTESVYVNFVDIIASLFDLIDQEDQVEKVFRKHPDLAYAAEHMESIKDLSHSTNRLPPNQQPMFRAKFVIHELFKVCRCTEFQFHDLWTPALVMSVARTLLNTVHTALGPLHACSVLRKVRLVICLAGRVVLESYCLEMLLSSVRHFIVDSECADDALGISQYLLVNGSQYLVQRPSFLAGYALSTLASLRVFLESSQASTTQESQFKATMSKAQRFHEWFSKYLVEYTSPAFRNDVQSDLFKSIIHSAAHIRSSGNAEKGTAESKLLLDILKDGTTGERLLNSTSRELALKLLCGDFTIPATIAQDIIETDAAAVNQASQVWKSCDAQDLSRNYLSWAGRVVGRSFAASGDIPGGVLKESNLALYSQIAPGSNGSEMGLLYLLQDLAANETSRFAGLSESALRTTVSEAIAHEDEPLVIACQRSLSEGLFLSSQWGNFRSPAIDKKQNLEDQGDRSIWDESIAVPNWLQNICIHLAALVPDSILLSAIRPILSDVPGFAEKAFPFIVHLVLCFQMEQQQNTKKHISNALRGWLQTDSPSSLANTKLLINTILYLRTQQYPKESSIADRLHWLDVDYTAATKAASRCGMHKSALLFAELCSVDTHRASRRSSAHKDSDINDTLLKIFENIDDPDTYYGLPEEASLSNVLARVEYENEGSKVLAFRGAQYDSHLRLRDPHASSDGQALVRALGSLGLSGLSHSVLQTQENLGSTRASIENTFNTARRLELWNLPAPGSNDHHTVVLYQAYQSIHHATDLSEVQAAIYNGFSGIMSGLAGSTLNATALRARLSILAALTELDDLLNVCDAPEIGDQLKRFKNRADWMRRGLYGDVSQILSCRETTVSMLGQHVSLLKDAKLSTDVMRRVQVESMIMASGLYRYHKATQESLNISTTLTKMIPTCEELGLHVDAAIKIEVANCLWDHGEMGSSIRMLQAIDRESSLTKQSIHVSRSDLLSKIGHKVSLARLENPHDIQRTYLGPALKELKRDSNSEAGSVYHQFATFCDEQLQDPDGLEDLARLQNLRRAKNDEVRDLKILIDSTKETQLRTRYSHVLSKEKQWLELDEKELRRVEQTRVEFVQLSLENYLLSLISSDEYNNDALRFTALWLERSAEDSTNKAVMRHLSLVPTRKFAALMNQLTSRLQSQQSIFQRLLFDLIYNICVDHPYHGMYQIWSGTKARAQQKDDVAMQRVQATEKVAQRLAANKSVADIWLSIDKTSKYYHGLAMDRNSTKYKSGAEIPLKDSTAGQYLISCLARYRIPPPTLQIDISATKDYSDIPIISKLQPTMTIASGVSAPKIITAVGSNGVKYKQLVKGGHDDLRQDAIMEQVFAAVSSLLKLHRSTQQRNLGIRTYKVLPLTASSGLIEFVPNTIPLHEFLMPAHERYYPRDLKGSQCRKEIFNVQNRTAETRLSSYRKVTEKFHPVMRYFFMEYFVDPDEWFSRRLAYTRSTAAISMLGHVLGLGDRHGHNILLDKKTGEAVHIDLGVAFEAGRILPVPELVPFRLTRDIVDGMGITKTEGVFRRCCEFTLDALREEQYSIMTILDVLRYDPLYTWSISPLRLAKLQKARHEESEAGEEPDASEPTETKKANKGGNGLNEPSEADRALEIVRKKLSKTLSVTATVNDLINQATDERNLAVLYSGWAAYA